MTLRAVTLQIMTLRTTTSQIDGTSRNRMDRNERNWFIGLITPPILVACMIVLVVVLVVKTNWEQQPAIHGGGLFDKATVYDANTSVDNSSQWQTLSHAVQGLDLRFDGLLETSEALGASQISPGVLKRFSEEAQPLISDLKDLLSDGNAVWNPNVVTARSQIESELNGASPFIHLLEIEFHAAVSVKDSDRALQTLQLLVDISPVLDYSAAFDFYLWHETTSCAHQRLIAESLDAGFWNEAEQLAELQSQLSAFRRLSADRGGLQEPWNHLSTSDIITAKFKYRYRTQQHDKSLLAKIIEVVVGEQFAVGLGSHGLSTDAAIRQLESEHRMTRTAIGIKQFRLQENRWPASLSELKGVGLSAEDMMFEPGTPFGYQVDSGGVVRIWMPEKVNGEPLSIPETIPTRVRKRDYHNSHIFYYRTIIIRA